ncbi:NTF2-related export protein 2 [Lingula anatina]|uniref:NTF2-related export protein n=1 Tax=Lingula anatina TaxID=7574 RepID=A0A1S3KFQ2_LINAN|nr:NTF2-related export protein 2 [Lingula anatina]|eukprot:XP_013421061.1 NTF2-related export protein 2 [Lingula anatina]
MATDLQDPKFRIDQASQAGQEFAKLYYETFDKRRTLLPKLYLPSATMVWQGNPVSGMDAIAKFQESLPTSEVSLESVDCQPLPDSVTQGQTSILVSTCGAVTFHGNPIRTFTQSFMLTVHKTDESKAISWKIASDCFRLQDS